MPWRHKALRPRDLRPSAAARGYDSQWAKIRAAYLKRNPLCEWCGRKATMVDHRLPLKQGGTNDDTNLQSMDPRCHALKTARDGSRRRRPSRDPSVA